MTLLLAFAACTGPTDTAKLDSGADTAAAPTCAAAGPLDAQLTLADVQALGTHNSYHVEPDSLVDASHAYTQPPLDVQADLGVRAFELDVHRAEDGSFPVLHLPVLDPESTCATLPACLAVLRDWSFAHPCHTPFTVWLEPKDDLDAAVEGYTPLAGHLLELDAAITSAWPRDRLITPDDLRGTHATLPEGVAAGWPPLADTRGKMLLALLDSSTHRAEYLDGAPTLEGRVIFAEADSSADPYAAVFKIDDAPGSAAQVQELVAAGFLVTSNIDGAGNDDAANQADLDATLLAGPHNLASDFVRPVEGHTYVAELPGGSPRCHPARVPEGCTAADLEPDLEPE